MKKNLLMIGMVVAALLAAGCGETEQQQKEDAVKASIEKAHVDFNYTSEGQNAGGRGL